MLAKSITFEDFNGVDQTEVHYFHISKADIVKMELDPEGGMSKLINDLVAEKNGGKIMALFTEFLRQSYGVKSPDGRKFEKLPEFWDDFVSSPAFDALLMELVTDLPSAIQFVQGIFPKDIANSPEISKKTRELLAEVEPDSPKLGLGRPAPSHVIMDEAARFKAWRNEQPVSEEVAEFRKWDAGQKLAAPDPNGLDVHGVWPGADDHSAAEEDERSGLQHPRNGRGNLVPWAFREPNSTELISMNSEQMADVYSRKSSGWSPPES